jgi:hypothetical protein
MTSDSVQHLSDEIVTVIFEDNREICGLGSMVESGLEVGSSAAGGLLKYNRSTGERERFSNVVDDAIQSSIQILSVPLPRIIRE